MIAMPRFGSDDLAYARDQVIRHIRYTQHLALMDDKYLSEAKLSKYTNTDRKLKDSTVWFKKMWQIQFHQNKVNNLDDDSYSIYSDRPTATQDTNYMGITPIVQFASDPQTGLWLAGRPAEDATTITSTNRLVDVDITDKYGVIVNMDTCTITNDTVSSNHILFDHLGRPYCLPNTFNEFNPYKLLSTKQIRIHLSKNNDTLDICVEPESGYVHEC